MERLEFDKLVRRMTDFEAAHPRDYARRVLALGILGYAYLFIILALVICTCIILAWLTYRKPNLIFIKIDIAALIFCYIILRSLWVKIEHPHGLLLERKDSPRLFSLIDRIQERLKAPKADVVLITDEFNAGIVQIPRLGALGWYKNYLCIGIPLMASCMEDQLTAVLTHEFGHFAGDHGRINCWIYRLNTSWLTLMEVFQQTESWLGKLLFGFFYRRYVPYFNAYSFVLSRSHEYAADRYAAEIAGVEAHVLMLVNTTIRFRHLEERFWNDIFDLVSEDDKPPRDVYNRLIESLRETIPPETIRQWVLEDYNIRTASGDSHPGLKDRIAAVMKIDEDQIRFIEKLIHKLGQQQTEVSSMEILFDKETRNKIIDRLNNQWVSEVEELWIEQHKLIQEKKSDLDKLDQLVQSGKANEEEEWERLALVQMILGEETAIPILQNFLKKYPHHTKANYSLGEYLLRKNHKSGIGHIEKAIGENPAVATNGLQLIAYFLEKNAFHDECEEYLKKYDDYIKLDEEANLERKSISSKDTFMPCGLSEKSLQHLSEQLRDTIVPIQSAFIARKEVKIYPQHPLYVIGVLSYRPWYKYRGEGDSEKLLQELLDKLSLENELGTLFIIVNEKRIIKRLEKAGGELLFSRSKKHGEDRFIPREIS